jgi:hypothetical protein
MLEALKFRVELPKEETAEENAAGKEINKNAVKPAEVKKAA